MEDLLEQHISEQHVKRLKSWIRDEVGHHQPEDTFSFLQGVETALNSFAICRDGERYFGSSEYTTRELAEALKQFEKEQD